MITKGNSIQKSKKKETGREEETKAQVRDGMQVGEEVGGGGVGGQGGGEGGRWGLWEGREISRDLGCHSAKCER